MDLETENRIAAILLKEAAELRRKADEEGVLAYLQQPKGRGRPNSRFLTATVLGVQQANRAIEMNEMWRTRRKELELDDRLNNRSRESNNRSRSYRHASDSSISRRKYDDTSCSSSKRVIKEDSHGREDDGLKDEEVDEFLNSRVKRGRGAIGSRMDETGPYLPDVSDTVEKYASSSDKFRESWEHRVLGPEKPTHLKSCDSSDEDLHEDIPKKHKSTRPGSSNKHHSSKHRSRGKGKDKKKKKSKDKRSKHQR
ncbi:hypothetical protein RJ641_019125 [Dillenia turbinata]|uniref:Uncharacterized protein n=1 Tax=Dillenia turbinata TaxID=194707 RepID=A0AAN8UNX7_9MAGN